MPRRLWHWMAVIAACGVGIVLFHDIVGRIVLAWAVSFAAFRGIERFDASLARRPAFWTNPLRIPLFVGWSFFSLSFLMISVILLGVAVLSIVRGFGG